MNISKAGPILNIGTKSILISSIKSVDYDDEYVYMVLSKTEPGRQSDSTGSKIDYKTVSPGYESARALRNYIISLLSGAESPWYGIQYDTASPSPVLLRIASDGGMWQHVDLPVQSKLRRCVIDGVTGELKYYLHPNDSTLKADGVTDSVLDGTDGQVMVEIPEHWRKCEEDGTLVRVKISESELEGGVLVPKMYISAFEPTLDRCRITMSSA